ALHISCPRGSVFLGPHFAADELRQSLGKEYQSAVELQNENEFAEAVAVHLHAGRVVGCFYGAMEFGPRALGHRSLLVRATDPDISASLNTRLHRTDFMPFAPVTLRARASEAYEGWDPTDLEAGLYMSMCYEATPAMRELCPAVVHLDGTARPQVVDERDGLYFKILERYAATSGVHTLINTSFNLHEEPIVCSPKDALAAFRGGACDVLAMFPFLITPAALQIPGT
ncbi:unnamed protein product, partial [Polarella glacialis]